MCRTYEVSVPMTSHIVIDRHDIILCVIVGCLKDLSEMVTEGAELILDVVISYLSVVLAELPLYDVIGRCRTPLVPTT